MVGDGGALSMFWGSESESGGVVVVSEADGPGTEVGDAVGVEETGTSFRVEVGIGIIGICIG